MPAPDASASGRFAIGGDLPVTRLGFGAMRITGDGVWGAPRDRAEALRVLRRLPGLGVDFIDTADSYGSFVSEDLIAEALHPYDGLVVATKGGLTTRSLARSPTRRPWTASPATRTRPGRACSVGASKANPIPS